MECGNTAVVANENSLLEMPTQESNSLQHPIIHQTPPIVALDPHDEPVKEAGQIATVQPGTKQNLCRDGCPGQLYRQRRTPISHLIERARVMYG
ncbi:hypothetical protein pipiens_013827 [Culex pipiens pipiens]|uniref:Uncharacterized protein n=1 Tax=Culex pipiens pipiens TaxID=38569 RepID=A0ABD1CWW9_CULPP